MKRCGSDAIWSSNTFSFHPILENPALKRILTMVRDARPRTRPPASPIEIPQSERPQPIADHHHDDVSIFSFFRGEISISIFFK